MPLDDEDAIAALERGLAITDYALRTTRYPLKNVNQIKTLFDKIKILNK